MPQIGEVKHGKEIGKGLPSEKFKWLACPNCKKERWVYFTQTLHSDFTGLCVTCRKHKRQAPETRALIRLANLGEKNHGWKGGRWHTPQGYVKVRRHNHPLADKRGYIFEHRLIMEQVLGRVLLRGESVHHKNGILDDNRVENLELLSPASHSLITTTCQLCSVRQELRAARKEIKQLAGLLQERLSLS